MITIVYLAESSLLEVAEAEVLTTQALYITSLVDLAEGFLESMEVVFLEIRMVQEEHNRLVELQVDNHRRQVVLVTVVLVFVHILLPEVAVEATTVVEVLTVLEVAEDLVTLLCSCLSKEINQLQFQEIWICQLIVEMVL